MTVPPVRADDPGLADAAHDVKSAYVHIPFCRRRCPYCDFAVVEGVLDDRSHRRYVDAVIAEIAMESPFGPLGAINFGGGTPSAIAPEHISTIVSELRNRFGVTEDVEVSIEVNPEDWTDSLADGLVAAGVDRVSIGAQSMSDNVLGALGRLHAADQVTHAVHRARSAGFRSVSVDLILGHPAESSDEWARTVGQILSLPIDHVSTYALTVEPGTVFARLMTTPETAPDDDAQADRYELFTRLAGTEGIDRYEVSNHARPGHACRYNLSTWAHGEYIAFGLGAHDHRWGLRSRNHRRLDRYLESVEGGARPRIGSERLDGADQERDRLMLGLRLAAGTPMSGFAARFVASDQALRLIEAGVMAVHDDRVVVLDPLRADMVAREALSVTTADC
ncbi:MAG TPA: radical SAM family heme chaperone HemW [Acidimicrobiia bacterium]|nr:radical SAM family heme chaperone HemW [Acidimicrobiia bacterium]